MKYSMGIDFGSLSARSVLVNLTNGEVIGSCVSEYRHAVMDEKLPSGVTLGADWALQHPEDYLDALSEVSNGVIKETGVSPTDIVGLCIDFTASTVMPVKSDTTPLCFLDRYKDNPHAYVKMWKHHSAQPYADKLREVAEARNEKFLTYYSGKVSSEWLIPKLWQIFDEDRSVYDECDKFIEAGDWINWMLTGTEVRSACGAGYKACWNYNDGYPSKEFFKALDPGLENVVEEKLSAPVKPLGSVAGYINESGNKLSGLAIGTPVCVSVIDAHAAVPASGVTSPGKLLMIMGTSTCHMVLGKTEKPYPGICGIVKDGMIAGYFGYEAGQACVGDHFDWFVNNCTPAEYVNEAKDRRISIHTLLSEKAEKYAAGESGLLALDWWNGCRSDLMESRLTGAIFGMTLQTKPEEIYRALIEATAFGTKIITDMFSDADVLIDEIYACGGIAKKNPFMMQIYADILDKPIYIVESEQAGALGSAMFAAVGGGFFKTLDEAASVMVKKPSSVFVPNPGNTKTYAYLFGEYKKLHDYFGKGENDILTNLKNLK
ncbi:MAG: ribulokinase [Clostridia bacterium]|nr:ribulokinase [Clostridia bacterium]